jgi:hypothetical protein
VNNIQSLLDLRKKQEWWSPDRLLALGELMDSLLVLDLVKDTKSAINNDFSAWRRAITAQSKYVAHQATDSNLQQALGPAP